MAEMIVTVPEVKRIINDYDIIFESGMVLPLSIDTVAGDTIDFQESVILVHFAAKPSPTNPAATLPAESTTIFIKHVASIQHRVRLVTELTQEQKHDLHKTWQELTTHPTIQ